jgi:hypothetical protein
MYMTSISTYLKKRSSTSTPRGLSPPSIIYYDFRVSNICSLLHLSGPRKSPLLQTKAALSITTFLYLVQSARKNKSLAIVFKPRKRKARAWKDLKGRSENFVAVVKEKKKDDISQLLKEAAVTCQNDHVKRGRSLKQKSKTKDVCIPTPVWMHPMKNGLHRMQNRIRCAMWDIVVQRSRTCIEQKGKCMAVEQRLRLAQLFLTEEGEVADANDDLEDHANPEACVAEAIADVVGH